MAPSYPPPKGKLLPKPKEMIPKDQEIPASSRDVNALAAGHRPVNNDFAMVRWFGEAYNESPWSMPKVKESERGLSILSQRKQLKQTATAQNGTGAGATPNSNRTVPHAAEVPPSKPKNSRRNAERTFQVVSRPSRNPDHST